MEKNVGFLQKFSSINILLNPVKLDFFGFYFICDFAQLF